MSLITTDKQRIIVGLGSSGLSVARYLAGQGLSFAVADTRENPPGLEKLKRFAPMADLYLGELDEALLCAADELIVSPGVALAVPALQAAAKAGVQVLSAEQMKAAKGTTCLNDQMCPGYLRCFGEDKVCQVPLAMTGVHDDKTPVVTFTGGEGKEIARYYVELATNNPERMRGLMYRPTMKKEWGMLFVYPPGDRDLSFWMKNTYIPLDMVFIDTGGKVVHVAPNTTSTIISKSISKGNGRSTYRGLCKVHEGAVNSRSNVVCDALLINDTSRTDTYPYIEVEEKSATVGHEATVSKVGDEQLFYLKSRGMTEEEAMALIVRGFIEPIAKKLPLEYAVELNRLIELEMEGSVG